jgi:hypothetical protein
VTVGERSHYACASPNLADDSFERIVGLDLVSFPE